MPGDAAVEASALRPPDGGSDAPAGGGSDASTGGSDAGDAAPADQPAGTPIPGDAALEVISSGMTGIRAFDATFSGLSGSVRVPTDGFSSKSVPVAASQSFTLVLDFDRGRAYVRHEEVALVTLDARTFRLVGGFGLQTNSDEALVSYTAVTFAIDGDKLIGMALASASSYVGFEQPAMKVDLGTALLRGGPDVTPPVVWRFGLASDFTDPWRPFDFFVSEALRPSSVARLVGSMGDSYVYAPYYAGASGHSVALFENPKRLLRYGSTYHVDTTTMVDFAGNALAPFELKTPPVPPLATPDGFESLPLGAFAGGEVVTAPTMAPIAGTKGLFVRASCDDKAPARAVVRLALPAGAKTINLSYRLAPDPAGARVSGWLFVGVEGGIRPDASWSLLEEGKVAAVALPVPAGATNEVVVAVNATLNACPNGPGSAGVLIDDLVAQ
jgi:hypothetical protein